MPISVTKKILLNLPRPFKKGLVVFCDLFICTFSVWLAFGLRLDQWGYLEGKQWLLLCSAILISSPLFISFGLYRAIFRYVGSVAFNAMMYVFIIYGAIFFSVYTLIGVDEIPRSVGVIQPILMFLLIGISRYVVRHWLGGYSHDHMTIKKASTGVLVYGAGSAGRQLVKSLLSQKEMQVKGFIDDDSNLQKNTIDGVYVFPSAGLKDVIHQLNIRDVLLAIPSASQDRRREIINSLNECGVRVRTLPGMMDIASGRVKISDLHDLDMNDLLGRSVVAPDIKLLRKNITNRVVLVTGAGGSIGSELCRQIIKFSPNKLILIDSSEHALYTVHEELKNTFIQIEQDRLVAIQNGNELKSSQDFSLKIVPYLASVCDKNLLSHIFKKTQPDTVFHAAAYKHVPLVEHNPSEGVRNNVFGTLNCAEVSLECAVSQFILVSTDKAVRPTNVMGASKRVAELILQAMAEFSNKRGASTIFSMVRFGNVLGSSGSVAPLFSAQIASGGPITLTHSDVTRYFMTIPEAAQLVIQASAMANGGDVFVLDMGDPVRIYDLAVRMIYLSGFLLKDDINPHGDIEIKVTGLRPGEKLYEELLIGDNPQRTAHPKIMKAHEDFLFWNDLKIELEKLHLVLNSHEDNLIKGWLKNLVPGYSYKSDA